jgi:hypothetical protein
MPPGSTHADTIKRLAEETERKHRIQGTLPETLNQIGYPRGKTIWGSATSAVMEILDNHPNVGWNQSGDSWRFEVIDVHVQLSGFDERAGRLIHGAKCGPGRRILPGEYRRIATALDNKGFKPKDWLEGRDREALAGWNQKHPREAFHTFSSALEQNKVRRWIEVSGVRPKSRELSLRRAVLKRFYRALDNYRAALAKQSQGR